MVQEHEDDDAEHVRPNVLAQPTAKAQLFDSRLERVVSEVIGQPAPQIAPKKLCAAALWQGGPRRRGRPLQQWCVLPAG